MNKNQKKWEQDVWKYLKKGDSHLFRNQNYEYEEEWIVNPIKKKISKNPDITDIIGGGAKRILPYKKFISDFKEALAKTGVPSTEYSLEFAENQPVRGSSGTYEIVDGRLRVKYERFPNDVHIFKYGGQEVWFLDSPGYYDTFFGQFFFPALDVEFVCKGLNVKALMDFMKDGVVELLEEYNYKRDYYLDICRHFIEADYETKYKIVAEGLFFTNPTRLFEVIRLPIEIEALRISREMESLKEFDNTVEISPYSVEKSFVIPFRTYMEKLIGPEDHLEIIPDPDDFQGVKVRLNDNTVYIRCEKHSDEPSVYFEPEYMMFESAYNDRLILLKYLVSYVYVGLRSCDKLLAFYKEYCKICNDLPYHMQLFMAMASNNNETHPLIHHGRICSKDTFPKWRDYNSFNMEACFPEFAKGLQQRGHQAKYVQENNYSYLIIDGFELNLLYLGSELCGRVDNSDINMERFENLLNILNASRYTTTNRWNFPIEEIAQAAENGDVDAMICMGAYHTGKYAPWFNQPVDYMKAVEWFERAIAANDEKAALPIALRNMAFFYSNGYIVNKDTKKAKDYMNLAKRVTYYDEQFSLNHNTLGLDSFYLE